METWNSIGKGVSSTYRKQENIRALWPIDSILNVGQQSLIPIETYSTPQKSNIFSVCLQSKIKTVTIFTEVTVKGMLCEKCFQL